MKRSGFKVQRPPDARLAKVAKQISADYTLQPRPVVRAEPNAGHRHRAVPKDAPLQHEGYMALVRRLPCIRCGVVGFSQFCHADEGKGMALKTDAVWAGQAAGRVMPTRPAATGTLAPAGAWGKKPGVSLRPWQAEKPAKPSEAWAFGLQPCPHGRPTR